jgi:hypothetical protein
MEVAQTISSMREIENDILLKSSLKLENKMPRLDIMDMKTSNPNLSNNTQAMLAEDLIQHSRILLDTLLKMQGEDKK